MQTVAICSFETIGERKILAEMDERTTWIYVQVILPVEEILQRRAKFIVEKQQYCREGSALDGAYLIYDSETDSLYFDEEICDHNAARERLAIGIIVCKALEKEGIDELRDSVKRMFLRYADQIQYGKANMENIKQIMENIKQILKTSYVSEHPNDRISYLSQAYMLEPKEEYRLKAEDQFVKTKAFFACQPDFHMNCINVRYWDRYWFGKRQCYGDLFSHHWSSLAG